MLEPDELPDDLHALERDLSQLPGEGVSDELRSRVMTGVRVTMRRETSRRCIRQRTFVVIGGLVSVAVLAFIVLRQHDDIPEQRQSSPRQMTMSNDEEVESVPLPTFAAYRLSQSDSPDDWEAVIERRADSFMIDGDEQARVIAWNDQRSMLEFGE